MRPLVSDGARASPQLGGLKPNGSSLRAATLKRRALLGGLALAGRTIATQLVVLGGQIILARRLTPREFGSFAIVQFALAFFTVFGDAGLGGALIQRKDHPTQRELSSVFWAQLGMGIAVLVCVSALASALPFIYRDLPPEAPWLLRLLALDFAATSLRVVPSILMERELQFVRLSVLDTANSVAFYLGASILVLTGAGIWSLGGGVLLQAIVALVLAYILRPWRPSLVFDRELLRPLLRFGIPFQLKFVLGMALSAITPVWGGRALGSRSVGLINWAQNTAHFPLRLVDIVGRVSFPLYSRLAGDQREFACAIERSVRITGFGTLFFSGLMIGLGPNVIRVVYSEQWLPALPLLYVYAATISIGFLTPVLATAFDALGDPKTVLRLSSWVTVGIWVTVPPASLLFRELGFAVGYVTWMVIGNVAFVMILRRRVPGAHVLNQLRGPAVGAVATACVGYWLLGPLARNVLWLTLAIVASAIVFIAVASIIDPVPFRNLREMMRGRKDIAE